MAQLMSHKTRHGYRRHPRPARAWSTIKKMLDAADEWEREAFTQLEVLAHYHGWPDDYIKQCRKTIKQQANKMREEA